MPHALHWWRAWVAGGWLATGAWLAGWLAAMAGGPGRPDECDECDDLDQCDDCDGPDDCDE